MRIGLRVVRGLALGWGLALAGAVPAAPVMLAPAAWRAGQTATYAFDTKLRRSVTVTLGERSRTQQSETDILGEIDWTVNAVRPAGGYDCTMTLTWMSVETRAGGDPTRVDSRRPAGADTREMHGLLRAMAGTPLQVTVEPDGRVAGVDGLDAMKSKAKTPDLIPDEADFVETASGLAALAGAPRRPLDAGERWDAGFTWKHDLGTVDEDWTYRLEGVEPVAGVTLATVTGEARSRLHVDEQHTRAPAGAPELTVRLVDRETTSRVLMDVDRGEAAGRYGRTSETVRFEMKLPAGTFRREMHELTVSEVVRVAEGG